MGSKRIVNLEEEAERPASNRTCYPSFMHQFYTVIHSITENVCVELNLVLRGELT